MITRRTARLNKRGQAATELAIFAFLLLFALGALLRYGQSMAKQQEMRMFSFRKALEKAYVDYADGSGYGGASYTAIKNIRLVSPFQKYYDGAQRSTVSGGGAILWDPDLFFIEDEEQGKPSSYISVDGIEKDLGKQPEVWDINTSSYVRIQGAREKYKLEKTYTSQQIKATTDERLTTTVMTEKSGDTSFGRHQVISKDETWQTPWK